MKGDELAAALFSEQGYLVVGSEHPMHIGVEYCATVSTQMQHPFTVVALSDHQSWAKQNVRLEQLGYPQQGERYPHYYCVEATAD